MINLAGNRDCDKYIEKELQRCGIPILNVERANTEVPYSIVGQYGNFTFRRAWYYWMVEGPMPLLQAHELYDDPVGKTDIRVAGHCGCPAPTAWARYLDADGYFLTLDPEGKEMAKWVRMFELPPQHYGFRYVKDLYEAVGSHVWSYHIDSELGLYLFAQKMRTITEQHPAVTKRKALKNENPQWLR
jgi:hypothetical protein